MRKSAILIIFLLIINFAVANVLAQKKGNKGKKEVSETVKVEPVGPPTVSNVINADLLRLSNGELVRLMGADAPVIPFNGKVGQEPWASQAKNFAERLALGKELAINGLGLSSDEYGRRIGLVYIGELWLDYELVKEGFAVVQNNRYLDNKSKQMLLDAQSEALSFGRGIWQTDNRMPLPPKEFRAANNLLEIGNPKDESWKTIISKSSTKASSNNSSTSNNTNSSNTTDTNVSSESKYAYAIDILENLKQLQERLDSSGLSTTELGKLIGAIDIKIQAQDNKIDSILNKCLREALDAYRIVLDAFKKRELARDEERARLSTFIPKALDLANKAISDAEKRLAQINKQR